MDDLIAYKYVRYAVGDLEWNAAEKRYAKSVNYSLSDIVYRAPDISKDGSTYTVRPFGRSAHNGYAHHSVGAQYYEDNRKQERRGRHGVRV